MLVRAYELAWSFKTKTNFIHVLENTHLKKYNLGQLDYQYSQLYDVWLAIGNNIDLHLKCVLSGKQIFSLSLKHD